MCCILTLDRAVNQRFSAQDAPAKISGSSLVVEQKCVGVMECYKQIPTWDIDSVSFESVTGAPASDWAPRLGSGSERTSSWVSLYLSPSVSHTKETLTPKRILKSYIFITKCYFHSSPMYTRSFELYLSWPTVVEGDPRATLFNSYHTEVLKRVLLLSLDCSTYPWSYLIMLNVKQRGIKCHFSSLWYDDLGLNQGLSYYWRTLIRTHIYIYICNLKRW